MHCEEALQSLKRFFAFLPSLITLVVFTGCSPSSNVVATVGHGKITYEEFRTRLKEAYGGNVSLDSLSPDIKRNFLDELVRVRLELLDALEKGLPSDSSIVHAVTAYRLSLSQALLLERELVEPRL